MSREPLGVAPDQRFHHPQLNRLLGELSGTVLEIGPGTGPCLPHLPREVEWIGLEPDRKHRAALDRQTEWLGRPPRVLDGVAEQVPLPDASVDGVVGTLVLCTVRDVDATLAEVQRVLRPGGRFVFLEHVAAPRGTMLRRVQALWARRPFGDGCRPDRETMDSIDAAGFARVEHLDYTVPGPFGSHLPFVVGQAFAHGG